MPTVSNQCTSQPQPFHFGLRTSDFLRISAFGLRFSPCCWPAAPSARITSGPRRWAPTPCRPSFAGATSTNAGDWKPAQPSAHLPRGSWWEMFGDSELNRLEGLATTNNQQLAAAFANFQQARALVGVARADFFPQISADPDVQPPAHQRQPVCRRLAPPATARRSTLTASRSMPVGSSMSGAACAARSKALARG